MRLGSACWSIFFKILKRHLQQLSLLICEAATISSLSLSLSLSFPLSLSISLSLSRSTSLSLSRSLSFSLPLSLSSLSLSSFSLSLYLSLSLSLSIFLSLSLLLDLFKLRVYESRLTLLPLSQFNLAPPLLLTLVILDTSAESSLRYEVFAFGLSAELSPKA
jgi:hypothetical protein